VDRHCRDRPLHFAAGGDVATSHEFDLAPMIDATLVDPRVDALVVPMGTGEFVCRKR
jgi:hypothetical protein